VNIVVATPTLLKRIDQLKHNGTIDSNHHRILRTMERETRDAVRGLVSELEITLSDLLGMKGEYLKCRALRHWWDDATFTWDYRPMGLPEVQLCVRCTMQRIQIYGLNGKRNGHPRYIPPPGYAFTGAARKLTNSDTNILRRYMRLIDMVEAIEMDPSVIELETMMARPKVPQPC
jgi:hypothetical protein